MREATPGDETWWTLGEAAEQTGYTVAAIRKWVRADPPRVTAQRVTYGRRERWEVLARDVRREARASGRSRPPANLPRSGPTPVATSLDQVTTLEEVTRLYRSIDELRAEIEERHIRIEGLQREIAALLQAPSSVPNN